MITLFKNITLTLLLCFSIGVLSADSSSSLEYPLLAQAKTNAKKKNQTKKKNNAQKQQVKKPDAKKQLPKQTARNKVIREEIQRYLGYETLTARYFSLPYDITVNSNVQGYFLEIGFLLLMFIPLIFLLGFRERPLWGMTMILLMFLLVLLGTSNGVIFGDNNQIASSSPEYLSEYLASHSISDGVTAYISASVYSITQTLYAPIKSLFSNISGERDSITYPLLILFFILSYFLIKERVRSKSDIYKIGPKFLLLYVFLWLILSAGIIWYGYLALPLATLLLFSAISYSTSDGEGTRIKKYFKYAFMGIATLWLLMATMLKISNIYVMDKNAGLNMLDQAAVKYQSGEFTDKQVFEGYWPNLMRGIDRINREDKSLIYRVGTMFPYFIRKNDERVYTDNLVALYEQMYNSYGGNKQVIAQAMKASGFKYIVINLNLGTVDKTPEQSLMKRFNLFLNYLYQNPQLEMLATDRVVSLGGQNQYQVFGDTPSSIVSGGTYAIYRIK